MKRYSTSEKCKFKPQYDITSHLSELLSSINQQTTSAGKDVEKGKPFALPVGMQISADTVESSMEIPQKNKNGSAFWPSNPTFRNISEGTQNMNSKEHKHPHVHCSVIYTHQDMEAAQVSINGWVEKTTMAHLHNEVLLSYKKRRNFYLLQQYSYTWRTMW